jgi:ABC-type transport system involved in multi-copper enzyme maturation permease subunit
MIWLSWRQHRMAVVGAAVVLLLMVAVLVLLGAVTARAAHAEPASNLAALQRSGDLLSLWNATWLALLLLPALAGVFLGAPLLAADLERGTHRLVWTQGIPRMRWLRGKLAAVFAAVLAGAALLGCVAQLTIPTQWDSGATWLTTGVEWNFFDQLGLALPTYLLFAVALGVAVGALIGRTLPSMMITGIVYVALRAAVATFLRPNYVPPLHGRPPIAPSAWILPTAEFANGSVPLAYQPADRFWTFQGIEAAIFLVFTIALLALTVASVLRREA